MKNPVTPIGNRNRDLPAQPMAPPRAPWIVSSEGSLFSTHKFQNRNLVLIFPIFYIGQMNFVNFSYDNVYWLTHHVTFNVSSCRSVLPLHTKPVYWSHGVVFCSNKTLKHKAARPRCQKGFASVFHVSIYLKFSLWRSNVCNRKGILSAHTVLKNVRTQCMLDDKLTVCNAVVGHRVRPRLLRALHVNIVTLLYESDKVPCGCLQQ